MQAKSAACFDRFTPARVVTNSVEVHGNQVYTVAASDNEEHGAAPCRSVGS